MLGYYYDDPLRAPTGQHVLWIMVRSVPRLIRVDAAGQIHSQTWINAVEKAFSDGGPDRLETYAPGLRREDSWQNCHITSRFRDDKPESVVRRHQRRHSISVAESIIKKAN